mmetsp:Transcript_13133/g.38728  ORF Transcript_13133/g.38728 Transcript_13133/m.38728 type:complete len:209 (+) Transcript_13133:570-1196(+)
MRQPCAKHTKASGNCPRNMHAHGRTRKGCEYAHTLCADPGMNRLCCLVRATNYGSRPEQLPPGRATSRWCDRHRLGVYHWQCGRLVEGLARSLVHQCSRVVCSSCRIGADEWRVACCRQRCCVLGGEVCGGRKGWRVDPRWFGRATESAQLGQQRCLRGTHAAVLLYPSVERSRSAKQEQDDNDPDENGTSAAVVERRRWWLRSRRWR